MGVGKLGTESAEYRGGIKMSGYSFRPAVREKVGLLIGLVGCSGSGKTYTAMRLATGIVGKGKRFAVIDTEARRSLHYAGMFDFDMCEVKAPFRPEAYSEAIKAADEAGYEAIVVDSFSHEWAGEGGILDWQEHELDRMAGDDWKKREACKMAAWIRPKMGHKQMIQRLLQVRANLILCFRAEEKVKMEKDANNKTVIVPIGWQPICSKEVPYEMTVSFLLTPDKPGYPHPLKLQEQHKLLFPLDRPINEESGRKVTEWADGGIIHKDEEVGSAPSAKDEIPEFSTENRPLTFDQLREKILATTALPHLKNIWVKYKSDINLLPSDEEVRLTAVKDAKKKELQGGANE